VALINEAARHMPPLESEDVLGLALLGDASRRMLGLADRRKPFSHSDFTASTMAAVEWGVRTAQPLFEKAGWIPDFDPQLITQDAVRSGGLWLSTMKGRRFARIRIVPAAEFTVESVEVERPPEVLETFVAVRFIRWQKGPLHAAMEASGRVLRSLRSVPEPERKQAWSQFITTREGMLSALQRELMKGTAGLDRERLVADMRDAIRKGGGDPQQDLPDCLQELALLDQAEKDLQLLFPGKDGYLHVNKWKVRGVAGKVAGVHRVKAKRGSGAGAQEDGCKGRRRRVRTRREVTYSDEGIVPDERPRPQPTEHEVAKLAMARAIQEFQDTYRDDPAALAALDFLSEIDSQLNLAAKYGVSRDALRWKVPMVEAAIKRAFEGAA
jgi:hypothetical protein